MFSHTFTFFLEFEIFPFLSVFAFYLPSILLHLHNKFRTMRNFFLNVLGVRAYYFNFVWPLTAKQTASIVPLGHILKT